VFLSELRVENLRNIGALQLALSPGLNLFTGANGAGKSSILEAAFVLSHGRSFRTRRSELLVGKHGEQMSVFGAVEYGEGATSRLGMIQRAGRWTARIDGRAPATLAECLGYCAAVCFDPGAHALISGSSEERRRFLDWGVFHVEHAYAETIRRYRRALRQRNAALRESRPDRELDAWDEELVTAAMPVCVARSAYLERLRPVLTRLLEEYLPELGEARLRASPGWIAERELSEALREARDVDRQRLHTTRGPHRADWSIAFTLAPRREHLSRGQEKLCAIACALAQAELYVHDHSEWPIVLLDDLPSELDHKHQDQVLRSLAGASQVLLTSTESPATLQRTGTAFRQFHVEQGRVQGLL
jgi:DNA replication and repair protein RecF